MYRALSTPRASLRLVIIAGLVSVIVSCLASPALAHSPYDIDLTGLAAVGGQVLHSYMVQSSASDPRHYSAGVWYATDGPSCWYCYDAAATGAAVLSRQPGRDPKLARVAITTFNTAIARHQLANGAFTDPDGNADGIATAFFGVYLGLADLELQNQLPAATRTAWRVSIANAATYLVKSGNATWYINGNINLRETEVLWLAWAITHKRWFRDQYDREWAFTIDPPQQRWPGFGLHLVVAPRQRDGSDGKAYLAESGGAMPGFDPSYTMVALDTATELWVLTHDPRYLRLMNLLFNQLRPHVSASWLLDGSGGTRKNDTIPFMSCALPVLAASGERPNLLAVVSSQLAVIESQYEASETYTHPNFYKGLAEWVSIPLLDQQWPRGMASDTRVTQSRSRVGQALAKTAPRAHDKTSKRNV